MTALHELFLPLMHGEPFFLGMLNYFYHQQFQLLHLTCSSVQSLSRVRLFTIPWTAACQASLFITSSWSLLKLMSIESVMLSNNLILCHPLLLLPSIFPSIRVFSSESNSMKLWAMPCRSTQDGCVMVEGSDEMWSTGEGNGKPLQ